MEENRVYTRLPFRRRRGRALLLPSGVSPALNHPDKSCDEGAREFLEELGFEPSEIGSGTTTYRVTLDIEIPDIDNAGYSNLVGALRDSLLGYEVGNALAATLNSDPKKINCLVYDGPYAI